MLETLAHDILSIDELINDDNEFEIDECGTDDRDWCGEHLAAKRLDSQEIVDLTSTDANNSPPLANFSNICPLQMANSSQAGAQSEVVDITRNEESMEDCDDSQCRRGFKRRLHTVCEWSSSSRENMIKRLCIDLT